LHASDRKLIIRLLRESEATGSELFRQLTSKGVRTWPNHVYSSLAKMEREGLLKSRWIGNPKRGLSRKHVYSLSGKGTREFRKIMKDSVGLLMSEFVRSNLDVRELSDHSVAIASIISLVGVPPPSRADAKVVLALPNPDPLICYPINFLALSDVVPNAAIYVVKPPGTQFNLDPRPNLVFVDGWRHEMPLRESFADYLSLDGFPDVVPEEETIRECARVLKDDGHLIVSVPGVMTEEKRPRHVSFQEFVLEQYYSFYGDDRMVSVARVRDLLTQYFKEVKDRELYGDTYFYAKGKSLKQATNLPIVATERPPTEKVPPASTERA
jgi:DNA-binding PadR family transcriptional regulator